MDLLEKRLLTIAPDNEAVVPIACSKEWNEDRNRIEWVVDAHVKVKGIGEFSIEGVGKSLPDALRRVYLSLNDEERLFENSRKSHARFGLPV